MFKHALIATDGSELSTRALATGLSLAKALEAKAPRGGRSASSLRTLRRLISEVNETTRRFGVKNLCIFQPLCSRTLTVLESSINIPPVVDVCDVQTGP